MSDVHIGTVVGDTPTPLQVIATLAEKVLWTYVQAVIVLLLAGGGLNADGLTTDLAIAALPAALTVLANGIPQAPAGLPFAVDLLWRVVRSGAAAFIGFLLAVPVFNLDATTLRAAGSAALVAVLVVVKGAIASKLGDPATPATLPASVTAPPLAA